MPIVSAVLYTRPGRARALWAELCADPRLTLAAPHRDRVALVSDTADRAEDKALWRGLEAREDVLRIELVLADFADVHPQEVR